MIKSFPGYETSIPTLEQRLADALLLIRKGGQIVMGVFVSHETNPHSMLLAEIKLAQQAGRHDGRLLLGPNVLGVETDQPFAPSGLAVWELPEYQA